MHYKELNINQKINAKVNKAWQFVFKVRVLKNQFIMKNYYGSV